LRRLPPGPHGLPPELVERNQRERLIAAMAEVCAERGYAESSTGGQIAPDASEGSLRLGGAIELLQLGAGQVFHKEYWLDLGAKSDSAEVDVEPTPAFPGKLGRIGVFDIGVGSVSSDPKSRAISVAGAPLTLTAATAQTFNEAFAGGKAVFGAGEAFGSVGFGALGQ
jgi:hypothetical protein